MICKKVAADWDFGEYPHKIVERDFVKTASWYSRYDSDPRFTFVNTIFLGAGEFYGPNGNADYFSEDELLRSHKTFLEGRHYKHHRNHDVNHNYGHIVEVRYNPRMHRVEGILRLDNDRNVKMINDINRGKTIHVSMGCDIDYDVCSICNNKAFFTKDYCHHMKREPNRIYSDGRRVMADNFGCKFFDLSEVAKGADSTAIVLRKVAGLGEVEEVELDDRKLATLQHLANIEKRIEGMIECNHPNLKLMVHLVPKEDRCGLPGATRMYRTLLERNPKKLIIKGLPKEDTVDILCKEAAINVSEIDKDIRVLKDPMYATRLVLRNFMKGTS